MGNFYVWVTYALFTLYVACEIKPNSGKTAASEYCHFFTLNSHGSGVGQTA